MYFASPPALQSLALSAYGSILHRQRYGGDAAERYRSLLDSQWLSEGDLKRYQEERLAGLVAHAARSVPYYARVFRERHVAACEIRTLDDLQRLPLLTKRLLRTRGRDLVAAPTPRGLFALHTSGTTGSPLAIWCTPEGRRYHYAFLRRFKSWHGVELGMRRASFFGRTVVAHGATRPPFWRYDASENNELFSSYHMSDANLPYYAEQLAASKPAEISGYPSSLYVLARYLLRRPVAECRPRLVMTTAETLLEYQRTAIEEAFQCPVRDQYGCTEMAVFVGQCEYGTYHVNPEYGIVEVLDEDGEPVSVGQEGSIVCTSFVNEAMPLIRYALGDRVAAVKARCKCGRQFPALARIAGRQDDVVLAPSGAPVGRLDPIFKGNRGILESQLVQVAPDVVELKVVRAEDFDDEDAQQLRYELYKRLGNEMKIRIDFVEAIPREPNGKFRAVVSRLDPSARGGHV